jgi:hypothetical protein
MKTPRRGLISYGSMPKNTLLSSPSSPTPGPTTAASTSLTSLGRHGLDLEDSQDLPPNKQRRVDSEASDDTLDDHDNAEASESAQSEETSSTQMSSKITIPPLKVKTRNNAKNGTSHR